MLVLGGARIITRDVCSRPISTLPASLLRAWRWPCPARCLSTTHRLESRIGRTPIAIPPGVDLLVGEPVIRPDATTFLRVPRRTITVKGPLGSLSYEIPPYVEIDHDTERRMATLSVQDKGIEVQRQMWGTSRVYIQNHVKGVSEGHTAILRLVGVGYRASVERLDKERQRYPDQHSVILKLGFAHPVEEPVPEGIKVTIASPTRVLMEGIEKELLMSFAAILRKWRPPEPYKGKGIFINDQVIKLKGKKGK